VTAAYLEDQGRLGIPLIFFNTGSSPRSLKNKVRAAAGDHQTIVSAVRTNTRSGRISTGSDRPSPVINSTNICGVISRPSAKRAPLPS
jgi:hypothetical protein